MELPAIDAAALAQSLVRAAQTTEPPVTRLRIPAEQRRALAHRRRAAAVVALPLFAALGALALVVSLDLALIAVICGFMVFACLSLAREAARAARRAVDQEITVVGDRLQGADLRVEMMLVRRDYVRLILGEGEQVSSLDLALTSEQRAVLGDGLRAAGVRVKVEGPARRVLELVGALALGLLGLFAVKTAQGITTVLALASWPLTCAALGVLLIATWLLRRAR